MTRELTRLAAEHLLLVVAATAAAAALGVPLGLFVARRRRLQQAVMTLVGALQTVPSLALFGLLLPLPLVGGVGVRTALVAMVVYALLPILRNTVVGVSGVDPSVREAATAMGMTPRQVLLQVELPLAAGVIVAGIRLAAVIGVGVATIGAAVGAGGLGTLIFRGLRMNDDRLLLTGAAPAAAMALLIDAWLAGLTRAIDARVLGRPRARALGAALTLSAAAAVALMTWGQLAHAGGAPSARPTTTGDVKRVIVGSKDFSEQVILGELLAQELEARGVEVVRRFELGGSLCHQALLSGELDVYPEYTGTAFTALLHHPPLTDPAEVYRRVTDEYRARFDLEVSAPLGFRNDFAILVRGEDARRLHLTTLSQAAAFAPTWQAGFGQDFMSRQDGYPGFARTYGLQFRAPPREMDLSLTYRALAERQVDLIAGDSTNGLIDALDLVALEDDRRYFPPYQAVFVARRPALAEVPALAAALAALGGALPTATMRRLNHEVDGDKRLPAYVARAWRASRGALPAGRDAATREMIP